MWAYCIISQVMAPFLCVFLLFEHFLLTPHALRNDALAISRYAEIESLEAESAQHALFDR